MGVRCKLDFRRSVLILECPKGDIPPGSETSRLHEAGEESLQRRSLMVDDDGLFISWPVVVKILHDNRPVLRRFDFSLMRVGVLLLQAEMTEDAFYDVGFMDGADELHFLAASRTTERVHFPDLLGELPPCFGRHPAWLMVRHIQHGHFWGYRQRRRPVTRPEEPDLDSLPPASARVPVPSRSSGQDPCLGRENLKIFTLANPSCKSPHLKYSSTTSSTTGRKNLYCLPQCSS